MAREPPPPQKNRNKLADDLFNQLVKLVAERERERTGVASVFLRRQLAPVDLNGNPSHTHTHTHTIVILFPLLQNILSRPIVLLFQAAKP